MRTDIVFECIGFLRAQRIDSESDRIDEIAMMLDVVTPMVFANSTPIVYGDKKSTGSIKGVKPDYEKVQTSKIFYGRTLNDMDEQKERKVCIIGKKIYQELVSPGVNPCGERIKVDNVYYQIVGVDYNSSAISIGSEAAQTVTIPFSVCRKRYNYGNQVHFIAMTGRTGVVTPLLLRCLHW